MPPFVHRIALHDSKDRAADGRQPNAFSTNPLMAAALPDEDGVMRARWRTNSTRADRRRDFLRTVRKGEIRTGRVAATPRFGVFVDLDDDLGRATGFINIPELSWTHFDTITDVVQVGQEIRFEVLAVDLEREQVALSLKATQEDPWRRYFDTHHVGDIVPGTVTKLVPFGAFVHIEPGIEGLVHLTELSTNGVGAPEEVVREGDNVLVLLLGLDFTRRRICLSMRQVIEVSSHDPAATDIGPTPYGAINGCDVPDDMHGKDDTHV